MKSFRTPHTSHDATPIAVYSALHTGPNTQFGGFQWGFFNVCTAGLTSDCAIVTIGIANINRRSGINFLQELIRQSYD